MLPNPLDIKHWAIPRAGWARGPLWTLWLSGRVSLPPLHPYILSPHPFASYLCCVSFQWWLQSSSPLCALSVWYQSELCHRTSSCSHRFVRKLLLLMPLTEFLQAILTTHSQKPTRPFLSIMPPHKWEWPRSWKATHLGQLIPVPYPMASHIEKKSREKKEEGGNFRVMAFVIPVSCYKC